MHDAHLCGSVLRFDVFAWDMPGMAVRQSNGVLLVFMLSYVAMSGPSGLARSLW